MFVTSQTETDRHKMALATFSLDHKLTAFFSSFFLLLYIPFLLIELVRLLCLMSPLMLKCGCDPTSLWCSALGVCGAVFREFDDELQRSVGLWCNVQRV